MKNLFNINVCRRGALLIPLLSIEAREVVLCPSRAAFGATDRVLTHAATGGTTDRALTHAATGEATDRGLTHAATTTTGNELGNRVLTQTATTG